MIGKISNGVKKMTGFWSQKGYLIIVFGSLIFIVLFAFIAFASGQKGTHDVNPRQLWNMTDKYATKPKHHNVYDTPRDEVIGASPRDSKGETQCRRVLQKIFGKPFVKARPNFLKNPITGKYNLELDCYNSELRLACEYNGEQHYVYNSYFHRNKDQFLTQKYRDELKKRMCKDNNVNLIEVPYTVKLDEIENYLISACRQLGYL